MSDGYNGGNSNNSNGGGYNGEEVKIVPLSPDKEAFRKLGRAFSVFSVDDMPESVQLKVFTLMSDLKNKEFIFRYNGSGNDTVATMTYHRFKANSDTFLPFKTFRTDAEDVLVDKPTKDSLRIAAHYVKDFNDKSLAIRSFSARDIHVMLGEKCNAPLNFLIIYSKDCAEIGKECDYKTTKTATFPIRVAEDLNIPVFNLAKENRIDQLVEFVNNF